MCMFFSLIKTFICDIRGYSEMPTIFDLSTANQCCEAASFYVVPDPIKILMQLRLLPYYKVYGKPNFLKRRKASSAPMQYVFSAK
jgi:hypothetical protein